MLPPPPPPLRHPAADRPTHLPPPSQTPPIFLHPVGGQCSNRPPPLHVTKGPVGTKSAHFGRNPFLPSLLKNVVPPWGGSVILQPPLVTLQRTSVAL